MRLLPALWLVLAAGCSCGDDDDDDDSGPDGGSECADAPERSCGHDTFCCPADEECVDDLFCALPCPNERCGDNGLVCCAPGQACLDGVVCAADCEEAQALCGAALDRCCDGGQVCLNDDCVTPGAECGDDYDCLDEGTYCEPTVGRCLPQPGPPLCEVRPDFEDVALEVEWHWEGVTIDGRDYQNVAASPAVGDVSGDGIPDVVVAAYAGTNLEDAVLVAVDGADGSLHWSIGPGDDAPGSLGTAAVGDLDPGDDALEIAYGIAGGGLRIVDGDGVTELARHEDGSVTDIDELAPALADVDHDGTIEIAVGCQLLGLEQAGAAWMLSERFDAGPCAEETQVFAGTALANLDGDPELELTSGAVAHDPDGTRLWPAEGDPVPGIVAVADLDVDGAPEVIQIRGGTVSVRDGATGAVRIGTGGDWADAIIRIPGGGNGGAPTVADFDGDGLPEIAAAGQGCYAVYDLDCLPDPPRPGGDCTRPADDPETTCDDAPSALLRWARPTQDLSSSATGSSVFDFQGDGVAEAVYNDECFLHVYDGRDGRELLAEPRPNSSRTALEYPLVVDVDRDGNSEIVVPANDDQAVARDDCDSAYAEALGVAVDELPDEFRRGTHGLYCFGDPADRWVRTRPIWNQFTYHVTNVEDRGAVPVAELDNWTAPGLNNYRQNVQGAGVFNAPDLAVSLEVVALCAEGSIRLSAVVENQGSRGVDAGVSVEFVQLEPAPERSVETRATIGPLLPGQSERITITVPDQPPDVELVFEVRVDGDAAIVECDEDDNAADGRETCPSFG